MLGEYSQDMHDAPYVLEGLVENWEDEHSAEVIKLPAARTLSSFTFF